MGKLTMKDLENLTGRVFLKVDDPLLTTTSGYWQAIYGKKVWSMLNFEANVWGVLPKKPWEKSGERVYVSYGSGGGIGENASLPDVDKPDIQTFTTKPKTVVHGFRVTDDMIALSKIDDGLGDIVAELREITAKGHVKDLNKMLMKDNGTPAGYDFESLDRIVASNDELTHCTDAANNSYSTNDLDIYGLDRDAGPSWTDAVVLHNNGVDRELTLDLLDSAIMAVKNNGGDPKVIITGWDTLKDIQSLLAAKQRYIEVKNVQLTMNGVKTVSGVEAGFQVASYMGIPIIPTSDCLKDVKSRIYILDTDYLFIKVLSPTRYIETKEEDKITLNALAKEGYYITSGEVICTGFKFQAKIRDLM